MSPYQFNGTLQLPLLNDCAIAKLNKAQRKASPHVFIPVLCRVKILVLVTRTRVTFLAILEFTRDFFELRVETLEYLRVFSSIFHFPKQTNFDGGDRYACAYVHLAQFQKHAIRIPPLPACAYMLNLHQRKYPASSENKRNRS